MLLARNPSEADVRRRQPAAAVCLFAPERQAASERTDWSVGTGDLIALPILSAADGSPRDLMAEAAGRPAVLLLAPVTAGGHEAAIAAATALRLQVDAAGAASFVIVPEGKAPPALPFCVDRGGRFAHTLGLAHWDTRIDCARLMRSALLVLDHVGRVVASIVGRRPGPDEMRAALAACEKTSVCAGVAG